MALIDIVNQVPDYMSVGYDTYSYFAYGSLAFGSGINIFGRKKKVKQEEKELIPLFYTDREFIESALKKQGMEMELSQKYFSGFTDLNMMLFDAYNMSHDGVSFFQHLNTLGFQSFFNRIVDIHYVFQQRNGDIREIFSYLNKSLEYMKYGFTEKHTNNYDVLKFSKDTLPDKNSSCEGIKKVYKNTTHIYIKNIKVSEELSRLLEDLDHNYSPIPLGNNFILIRKCTNTVVSKIRSSRTDFIPLEDIPRIANAWYDRSSIMYAFAYACDLSENIFERAKVLHDVIDAIPERTEYITNEEKDNNRLFDKFNELNNKFSEWNRYVNEYLLMLDHVGQSLKKTSILIKEGYEIMNRDYKDKEIDLTIQRDNIINTALENSVILYPDVGINNLDDQ
jgi:hypothetical protein